MFFYSRDVTKNLPGLQRGWQKLNIENMPPLLSLEALGRQIELAEARSGEFSIFRVNAKMNEAFASYSGWCLLSVAVP